MVKLKYNYQMEPRFSDTDLYGVMHHSNHYRLFEEARYNFAKEVLGFEQDFLTKNGVKFFVVSTQCKYKMPIVYGQKIDIEVIFSVDKVAKLNFKYIVRPVGCKTIYAIGETDLAFVNEENRIIFNIPEWFKKIIDEKGEIEKFEVKE